MRAVAATLTALLALTAVAGCGGGSGDADRPTAPETRLGPDAITYEVRLRHGDHELTGRQRIGFRNPFAEPLSHVWVRAWDNAFGSCADPPVDVRGPVVERRHGCTALKLRLDGPVAPGERGAVDLRLAVDVPERFDRFGRLGAIDVLGNALPVLAVSERGAEPELPPYTFRGESFFSLVADWDVELELRPGEQVASTGQEVARDGRTVTLRAERERDFAMAVGPMQRAQRELPGGVRVRWFSPPGTPAAQARRGLALASAALIALQDDLGPYGARELDVLDTPPRIARGGLAMEYPQFVLSPAIPQTLSHEIAHQWFYRLVGNDQWSSPWIDETLASFAAIRLGREVHGPDRLEGCAQRDRPARPPKPVDASMDVIGDETRDTLYIEGPCALFNLQREIGRARMDAFLRGLVDRHRHGVLTTPELAAAIGGLPGGAATLRELRL